MFSGEYCSITQLRRVPMTNLSKALRFTVTQVHALSTLSSHLVKVFRDFVRFEICRYMEFSVNGNKRSGIYYVPFRRHGPVIIRSPEAIQELSEAPELSQRAVYADVCQSAQF